MVTFLPVPRCLALTNIFTESDVHALDTLKHAVLALQRDIVQSASVIINRPNEFSEGQGQCLLDFDDALKDILTELSGISNLVRLSAVMEDAHDEFNTNVILSRLAPENIKLLGLWRETLVKTAAGCSTSELVNSYAQKATALTDNAISAINNVNTRVAYAAEMDR